MTPEIVTYSQKAALLKARQNQYAREYYRKNRKKILAAQKRKRKAAFEASMEAKIAEIKRDPRRIVLVPYSLDSWSQNLVTVLRVAWKFLVARDCSASV